MNSSIDGNFNSLVVELGSYECRFGYSGDDIPQSVLPTNSVNYLDENKAGRSKKRTIVGELSPWRYHEADVSRIIVNGNVRDFDSLQMMFSFALEDWMAVDPSEYPMLLCDSVFSTQDNRKRVAQLVFEQFKSPAVLMYRDAPLSCFARAKGTGLVVDLGEDTTRVVPVVDGYALTDVMQYHTLAGRRFNSLFYEMLMKRGETVGLPRGVTKLTPTTTTYYHNFVGRELKEQTGSISEKPLDDALQRTIPQTSFTLPDGAEIAVGGERCAIPEYLFQPLPLSDISLKPLLSVMMDSVNRCAADNHRELYNNIVAVGGCSCFKGFEERLQLELSHLSNFKSRLLQIPVSDRRINSFIGGSIVASLPSFSEMWVSRQEYEEVGENVIVKKCL